MTSTVGRVENTAITKRAGFRLRNVQVIGDNSIVGNTVIFSVR